MKYILIIMLILLCSCFRQSFKENLSARQEKVKQDPDRGYSVEDLGVVQAYVYTYKGKSRLFVLHGRKVRYMINVDTLQAYKNRFEVSPKPELYK